MQWAHFLKKISYLGKFRKYFLKPNAKQEKIEKVNEGHFLIWVKEKPQEGKANKAVIKALSEYFDIPQSDVILVKGQSSREKIYEIKTDS